MVEAIFRSAKSLLETRPVFHRCDETIRGHVFCSFLALVLRKALQDRLEAIGEHCEWADVINDLDALEEVEVIHQNKRFLLRNETQGTCGKVFQATGVKMPPTVRQVDIIN
jgi:transposase